MTTAPVTENPAIVALIRHGQAAVPDQAGRFFSKAPVPLTQTGEQQAARAGNLLRDVHFDAIYASDLLRARQTAEIVSQAIGVPVQYDDQLREVDTGDLDGSTSEELERAYPAFLPWIQGGFRQGFASDANHLDPALRFPGGESMLEAADRAVGAFRRICARHSGRCVAVVSHAWVGSAILCYVLDTPPARYFRFGQANSGVSVVRAGRDGRGMLDGLNLSVPLGIIAGGSLPIRESRSPHMRHLT